MADEAVGGNDTAGDRRAAVLESALRTFARYGYRRTSMEQIAHDAAISRPGLYFLFASKPELFRQAVERSVRDDLDAAEHALHAPDVPLAVRLLAAFDHWAGRYVGPLTRDVAAVVDDNPDLAGEVVRAAPGRFAAAVIAALGERMDPATAARVAQTLLSTSLGIKHQVDDRAEYLRRLEVAVDLLVADAPSPGSAGPRGGSTR